jgi:hypothetical protein
MHRLLDGNIPRIGRKGYKKAAEISESRGERNEKHILEIDRRNSTGTIRAGWRHADFGLGPK